MSHLSQFNTSIHNFIADIMIMNVLKSDVMKLESYVEIPSWSFIENKEIKISSTEIRNQRKKLRGKN